MFGFTKFGFTKSQKIALAVAGVVLSGAAIATQARAQFRAQGQLAQGLAPDPNASPNPFAAPSQIGVPGQIGAPGQVGTPNVPPVRTRRTPVRRGIGVRRVPIEPVPMPGDRPRPLPALPAAPDIRNIPGTPTTPISGISGRVNLTPICSVTAPSSSCTVRPYVGTLKISNISRSQIIRAATDPTGTFQVRLEPGMYVVEPDSTNFPLGTSQTITVVANVMRQAEFNFQGTIAPAPVGVTLPPLPGADLRPGVTPGQEPQ
jgi:hypothetical protein